MIRNLVAIGYIEKDGAGVMRHDLENRGKICDRTRVLLTLFCKDADIEATLVVSIGEARGDLDGWAQCLLNLVPGWGVGIMAGECGRNLRGQVISLQIRFLVMIEGRNGNHGELIEDVFEIPVIDGKVMLVYEREESFQQLFMDLCWGSHHGLSNRAWGVARKE